MRCSCGRLVCPATNPWLGLGLPMAGVALGMALAGAVAWWCAG